ncbi:hypothetical protein PMAYCL1PPCAC_31837, partial [Pristionchus mayeri]
PWQMEEDYFGNGIHVQPVVFSMRTLCSYVAFLFCCAGCCAEYGSAQLDLHLHTVFKIAVLILMELLFYSPLREMRPWRINRYISFKHMKRYCRGLALATSAVRY